MSLKGDGLTQCVLMCVCTIIHVRGWVGGGALAEESCMVWQYIWTNSPQTLTAYSFVVMVELCGCMCEGE